MQKIYRTKDGEEFEDEMAAIYHERRINSSEETNATQELMFELIKRASFNGFDGEHAVKYLKKIKSLWRGVTMGNDEYYTLRDIEDNIWHADTMKVFPVEGKTEELKKLLKRNLHPQEIDIEYIEVGSFNHYIKLWWD